MVESKINNNNDIKKKPIYPYIGLWGKLEKSIYVLFSGYREGTVIFKENAAYLVGDYLDNWLEEEFTRIDNNIVIELSNE